MFPWCLTFLKRSLIFPILLFPSISLHWSLRKAFLSLLAILWNSAFRWIYLSFSPLPFTSLVFPAICKASSDNHFAFLHFFFVGMVLITASYIMSWASVHSSSGTLIRSHPFHLLVLLLYNCKGFDVSHTWSSGFPYFLQLKSEFGNKKFMVWTTVRSQSSFCWLYRAFPSSATKNIINLISVLITWWCPCVESSLVFLEEGICYVQGILLAKLY